MSNVRRLMFDFDPDGPTLFSRIGAALIGAMAGAICYVIWVFFEAGHYGQSTSLDFSGLGKWFVVAGAVLGLLGGLAFAAELWSNSWQSLRDESVGFAAAVLVLIVVVLACFFVYKQFFVPG
jgi:hypothetical protein